MHLKEKLEKLAHEVVVQNGCQLFSFQLKGNATLQKIVLLADSENGITIDECGKISRQFDGIIEAEGLIQEAYTLEVSSPGIEHPLVQEWQYQRNMGRILKVKLLDGKEKTGILKEMTEKYIVLEGVGKPGKIKKEDKIMTIDFEQIKESVVQVSFN
jgi:ribosome maturation factor RimP